MRVKRLLGIFMSSCMVAGLLTGCPFSSGDTETNVSENDAAETTATESDAQEDQNDTTDAMTEAGNAIADLLREIYAMESYSVDTSITINQKDTTGDETEETNIGFGLKGATDGNGNGYVTISIDYDYTDSVSLSGDIFTITKVDDGIYLDMSSLYNLLMDGFVDDTEELELYAEAFGLTLEEIESLMVLGISVGDLDLNELVGESTEEIDAVMELIFDSIATAASNMDEDTLTSDADTYTITLDNDTVLDAFDAIFAAAEENIEDIYDGYVEALKAVDYTTAFEAVLNAIVDEMIEGFASSYGEEIAEAMREELEVELSSAVEEYQTAVEEVITELEDGKEEFIAEFSAVVEEYRDSKEELQAAFLEDDATIDSVLTIAAEGESGSRKITGELALTLTGQITDSEDSEQTTSSELTVTITAAVEEGAVEISAPETYSSISDAVEIWYTVYALLSEYEDTDTDGDDYTDTETEEIYSQSELAATYSVTVEDNQLLLYYEIDSDAVLVTAYDGMEFFQSGDISNMVLEFNDDYTCYISLFVFDSTYDADFYMEYYSAEMIDDDIYYYEDGETAVAIVYFADNLTIDIVLEADTEEALESITGGDAVETLKEILDLCEIIPAS